MATHSKGSYVAFRSKRNAPTAKEAARRAYIASELKKFCEEPFPNGAVIHEDENRSVQLPNGVCVHEMVA